jgi:thiol-disulfide isomerase/thioredoxin
MNLKVMRILYFCLFVFYFLLSAACRPAAAPVSVSNKPVSVNDVPVASQPVTPSKPVEEMTWAMIDIKTNTEGNINKLKDFQGKAVILDFWATNCPPCIAEIPHLKELQAKYGKENLEIVGMHVGDDEDRQKVPAFAEKLKIDYPLAVPEEELTRFIFARTDQIPQTAVFDRKGKLVRKIIGFDPQIKKDLDAAVEQAINSKS